MPGTVLTGKVQAWGPESGAGESAKGSRLALKREELSSQVSADPITLIKRKKRNRRGKGSNPRPGTSSRP